jgi:hypothetical protein
MMRKLLTLTLAVLLLGLFAAVVYAAVESGDDSPSNTLGTTDTTETTGTTETTTTPDGAAGDISGPCDEAENRNDARCAGVVVPPAQGAPQGGVDISGPCDEAEHANDPRCTGVQPGGGVDDHRGRGGDDVDSSGPGPGFDDSGHGGDDSGFDDSGDDSSGHGSDDSGHGSDDSGDDDSGRGRGRGRGGDDD